MTFLWLLVWLLSSTPHVDFDPWNTWAVALAVCALIDLLGIFRR